MGVSFIRYDFVVPIDSTVSISKFWFQVDEKNGTAPTTYTNGGDGYKVDQDQVIFTPAMGSTPTSTPARRDGGSSATNVTNTKTYDIVVGVRQELNPSQVYLNAFDTAIKGYTSILNQTVQLNPQDNLTSVAGYKFYSGSVSDKGVQLTVDVYAEISGSKYQLDFQKAFELGNVSYVTPTNVTESSAKLSSSAAGALLPSLTVTFVLSIPLIMAILS